MNKTLSNLHQFSSSRISSMVEDLTAEEWLAQPAGFANNIAWNLGHLLFVRQNLIYRNSGLDAGMEASMKEMYAGGTSPADWDSQPDSAALLADFKAKTAQLATDVEAGAFNDISFKGFELGGVPIESLDDSASFNLYHEGLHLGTINDLRDVIRGG